MSAAKHRTPEVLDEQVYSGARMGRAAIAAAYSLSRFNVVPGMAAAL
jgi:hypothetical protein